jgi:hypothetical protein
VPPLAAVAPSAVKGTKSKHEKQKEDDKKRQLAAFLKLVFPPIKGASKKRSNRMRLPAKNEQKSRICWDSKRTKRTQVRRREKVRQKVGEEKDEERMQVAEEFQQ